MDRVTVHFLNVGHGDCTFIEFPSGRLTMIDINNSRSLRDTDEQGLAESLGLSVQAFKSSPSIKLGLRTWEDHYRSLLVDPVDFYREHFEGRSVFRYIQTHPDMDHLSGLHRFFWQEEIPLENFWDIDHARTRSEEDFEGSRHAYVDWLVYELLRHGTGPNDRSHKVIRNLRRAKGSYWTDDAITVLSPTTPLIRACDEVDTYNNGSYILGLHFGGRTLILPGDAEGPAWRDVLDAWGETWLRCDVLKAAHHGRQSGYHREATEAMDPSIVVCSVGKKPETDATDEYEALGADVLSTRFHSTITLTMWADGEIWAENRKGDRVAELAPLAA